MYSASKLAAEEFPQYDVNLRSAVSIARRLQDPLAELVKIDPKAIGVGQYQHDMPARQLDEALSGVVEDCVNAVGAVSYTHLDVYKRQGTIDTIPEVPGLAVWKSGHIGVYIGGGQVIEAMGTKYGVVKTQLQGRGWTHWLEIPYINYD